MIRVRNSLLGFTTVLVLGGGFAFDACADVPQVPSLELVKQALGSGISPSNTVAAQLATIKNTADNVVTQSQLSAVSGRVSAIEDSGYLTSANLASTVRADTTLMEDLKGETGATGAQGPKGDTGDTGPQGPKGDTGDTPTITIGTVTAGDTPSVTNAGTATNPVLNFVLKTGPKGDTGATGAQGPKGDTGDTGAQGPAGKDGEQGPQGPAGADGVTPVITFRMNGSQLQYRVTTDSDSGVGGSITWNTLGEVATPTDISGLQTEISNLSTQVAAAVEAANNCSCSGGSSGGVTPGESGGVTPGESGGDDSGRS